MTHIDRRSFLATLGGAIGAAACHRSVYGSPEGDEIILAPAPVMGVAGKRKLERIGIQMYTVRTQGRTDLPGTLAQLSKIGFKEVEWWGSYPGLTPVQIKALLDQNGLTAPSVHIGIPRTTEAWTPIFESARALKHEWITAASPPFQARTVDDWKRLAVAFNEAGKRVSDAGFRFAYHNHTEGMKAESGTRPFEIMLADTDPSLVGIELDIHWAYAGGADAIDLIKRFPNRIRMVHVKDSGGAPDFKQADVGKGTYPWAKVFDATATSRIEHYFIEHDSPGDAMLFAKASFDYLSALEF
jgi:sugar phosphate isomerase/epimerase